MANAGDVAHLLLLVAACCLTAAVMSKSGQFILHTWLPDAMAGPTPVSALIHAATMVVAGIFMVARFYSVFFHGLSIGDGNLNLLAIIGGVTVLGGASLAFVQNDIKKVLAYSTVSQLGYMVMALGVGAWTAALFHLFTHAFFKAGLFLGSGSVAHSVHSFDMKKDMGGMKKFMPKTWATFMICTGALIGIPPLAGFWSKDEILTGGHMLGTHNSYEIFMVVGIIGAFMTAAYMTRCVYLTFYGEPRGAAADPHHHPHESGPVIVVPAVHPLGDGGRRRLRQLAVRPRRDQAALRALRATGRRLLPAGRRARVQLDDRHRVVAHRAHRASRSPTRTTGSAARSTAQPSGSASRTPATRCSSTSTTSITSTPA